MAILDHRRIRTWNVDPYVRKVGKRPALRARQGNDSYSGGTRCLRRLNYRGRCTTRRQDYEYTPGLGERLNLPREGKLEAEIIGNCR